MPTLATVFHNPLHLHYYFTQNPADILLTHPVAYVHIPKELDQATVVEQLNYAYEKTQHLDQPWCTATPTVMPTLRSTAVGDAIAINGTAYVVKGIGFEPLVPAENDPATLLMELGRLLESDERRPVFIQAQAILAKLLNLHMANKLEEVGVR